MLGVVDVVVVVVVVVVDVDVRTGVVDEPFESKWLTKAW
jgi:hypothetical protein